VGQIWGCVTGAHPSGHQFCHGLRPTRIGFVSMALLVSEWNNHEVEARAVACAEQLSGGGTGRALIGLGGSWPS
jgi:hypothetical protein